MIGLQAIETSIEEVVQTRPHLLMIDMRLDNNRR
jgi:hypothetical protein